MKKFSLTFVVLSALGLAACSSSNDDPNAYKGQVIFSQPQGENLKLTVRKNNCSYKQEGENEVIYHPYDSTLVVGTCVKVSGDNQGIKNLSTWSPRTPL